MRLDFRAKNLLKVKIALAGIDNRPRQNRPNQNLSVYIKFQFDDERYFDYPRL